MLSLLSRPCSRCGPALALAVDPPLLSRWTRPRSRCGPGPVLPVDPPLLLLLNSQCSPATYRDQVAFRDACWPSSCEHSHHALGAAHGRDDQRAVFWPGRHAQTHQAPERSTAHRLGPLRRRPLRRRKLDQFAWRARAPPAVPTQGARWFSTVARWISRWTWGGPHTARADPPMQQAHGRLCVHGHRADRDAADADSLAV